jgi:hypothetical protein
MLSDIYEYSMQPHIIVWSIVFGIMALLTLLSLFLGDILGFDTDSGVDVDIETGGLFKGLLVFFDIGHVPVTFLLMLISGINWTAALLINSRINTSHSVVWGLILAVPIFLGSVFLTKLINIPIKKLYGAMNADNEVKYTIIGSICTTLTEVTGEHGQAQIATPTSPLNIMVVCDPDTQISKGCEAVVVSESNIAGRYLITQLNNNI